MAAAPLAVAVAVTGVSEGDDMSVLMPYEALSIPAPSGPPC